MSLLSTRENRHVGASFTSVEGVQARYRCRSWDIDVPKVDFLWLFSVFWDMHWCLGFYTTYRHETCTKVSIFKSTTIWRWVLVKEGTMKIKKDIHSPLVVYPLWCWRNKCLKIFWQGSDLNLCSNPLHVQWRIHRNTA